MAHFDAVPEQWQRLGERAPDALEDTRLQLHWATQPVASVGATFVDPQPDDSHTNMEWVREHTSLLGRPSTTPRPFRAGIALTGLALTLHDDEANVIAKRPLARRTLDDAYDWLAQEIEAFTDGDLDRELVRPRYEMPAHPAGDGHPFAPSPSALAELARWYGNADLVLRALAAAVPHASEVRCWPHHFDIGLLMTLDPDTDAESARSIGIGLSPGDDAYPVPYFYVNPWPQPQTGAFPRLEGGAHWHAEGWTGAVLTGPTLVGSPSAVDQARRVTAYLKSAVNACLGILGAPPHDF